MISLFEYWMKWVRFVKGMSESNELKMALFGERIPDTLIKLCSTLEDEVDIYELTVSSEEENILVEKLSSNSISNHVQKEWAPQESPEKREKKTQTNKVAKKEGNENFVDVPLTSFFFKMGKLSEGELTRFIELESELEEMNL